MKKVPILIGTLFIGGIIVISSCSKGTNGTNGATGPAGSQGPAGPVLSATISGNVIMTNQYGGTVTTAYGTGYILLKNPTTNATVDSVLANSSTGQYTINTQTGTYNMLCVYPGYGMNEHQDLQVTGGPLLVDNKIAAIPNFNVTSATDSLGTTLRDKNDVFISGTIAPDAGGERTLIAFVGNSASVTSAPGTYSFISTQTIPADSSKYSFTITLATIYNNGFNYGNNVYFAVYGAANNYTYGAFTNYTYGQVVYTAISPTPVDASPVLTLP